MPIAEKRHRHTHIIYSIIGVLSLNMYYYTSRLMYWSLLEEEAIVLIYHAGNLGLYTFLAMGYACV